MDEGCPQSCGDIVAVAGTARDADLFDHPLNGVRWRRNPRIIYLSVLPQPQNRLRASCLTSSLVAVNLTLPCVTIHLFAKQHH